MKIIERPYLNELIELMGTPDIKVITGVRRSGKSILMESFFEYLVKNRQDANLICIDFNKIEFEELQDYHKLYEYIVSRYKEGSENFLLIDEVELCENFEKAINSLHSTGNYDIYLTGSNAFLLSSDLATLFTGRAIEIKVFPFSYKEFMNYHELTPSSFSFDRYVNEGGFPGSYLYPNEKRKYDYISTVYETIIQRDLIKRKRIRNQVLLRKISSFLIDNIASLTSISNIRKVLSSNVMKTNDKTVGSYIESLCQSFLFYKIKRYDLAGRKYLTSSDKYYLCDHSLKYATLGIRNMDYGRVYENIVAIELLRRGYEVYVGMLYKKEIDFVALKRDERIYIQVSDDISGEETFAREVDPLLKIKDLYPRILLARTSHPEYDYKGIRIIDIADWLSR